MAQAIAVTARHGMPLSIDSVFFFFLHVLA